MLYYTICFILFIGVCASVYMRIEAGALKASNINFCIASNKLKAAHLSDIHINKLYVSANKLLAILDNSCPDIIVMSGDYIESVKDIPKFIIFLEKLTKKYQVYLTLGNHDHKAFKHNRRAICSYLDKIQSTGAKVLQNEYVQVKKGDYTYNLIGIDDLKYGTPDISKAYREIKPSFESNCINIAISHNPDIIFDLPKEKTDYLLCGHFHGGQIWMPFRLEFKLMRREKLSKLGYYRGLHRINGINVYINRGLGNVVFPFRFFSTPEVAIIQFPAVDV